MSQTPPGKAPTAVCLPCSGSCFLELDSVLHHRTMQARALGRPLRKVHGPPPCAYPHEHIALGSGLMAEVPAAGSSPPFCSMANESKPTGSPSPPHRHGSICRQGGGPGGPHGLRIRPRIWQLSPGAPQLVPTSSLCHRYRGTGAHHRESFSHDLQEPFPAARAWVFASVGTRLGRRGNAGGSQVRRVMEVCSW